MKFIDVLIPDPSADEGQLAYLGRYGDLVRGREVWLCKAIVPTLREVGDPCNTTRAKHADCGPVIVARPRNEDYAEPPHQEKQP